MKAIFFRESGLFAENKPGRGMWVLVLGMLLLSSCLQDDEDSWSNFYISYGVAHTSQSGFVIRTDGGNTLRILENRHQTYPLQEGKRLIVNYTILRTTPSGYDVRINELADLLTKNPVSSSALSPHQQDSIGNDPIEITDIWLGGEKYLNINFAIYRNDPGLLHFINLVVNDEASTPERKVLQFRHNEYDDQRIRLVQGRVSFDISSLLAQDLDSVKLVVTWKTYNQSVRKDSGYYKRPGQWAAFLSPESSSKVNTLTDRALR